MGRKQTRSTPVHFDQRLSRSARVNPARPFAARGQAQGPARALPGSSFRPESSSHRDIGASRALPEPEPERALDSNRLAAEEAAAPR